MSLTDQVMSGSGPEHGYKTRQTRRPMLPAAVRRLSHILYRSVTLARNAYQKLLLQKKTAESISECTPYSSCLIEAVVAIVPNHKCQQKKGKLIIRGRTKKKNIAIRQAGQLGQPATVLATVCFCF